LLSYILIHSIRPPPPAPTTTTKKEKGKYNPDTIEQKNTTLNPPIMDNFSKLDRQFTMEESFKLAIVP